jgi:hypothetical protein
VSSSARGVDTRAVGDVASVGEAVGVVHRVTSAAGPTTPLPLIGAGFAERLSAMHTLACRRAADVAIFWVTFTVFLICFDRS